MYTVKHKEQNMRTEKYDLKMRFTERFVKILKAHDFKQEFFAMDGKFTSSTISEYANKRRGMSVDKFVILLRIVKFPNKFIREQITEVLQEYYAEVVQGLVLLKPKKVR